ncbi:MAG: hypothetical protein NT072_07480 [Deltaproteobacteria bacterium]|nr:hypothetical protein [Deltaproteobacteria bacterium]
MSFAPCFYAIVDGALDADPENAVKKCGDACSRIDKVNRLYGLKDFMGGYYINCDVLNEPAMPEFPGLNDLE